jgi:hypothetical protein
MMTITIKTLAGDIISLDNCSPNDSLLDLKRKITSAAAVRLGLDWPVAQQKIIRLNAVCNLHDDSESDVLALADGATESGATCSTSIDSESESQSSVSVVLRAENMSLQSLGVRDGDVMVVFMEDNLVRL